MSQCVTRKVDKENVDPKVLKTKNGKKCNHQNVLYVARKTQDL